MSVNKHLERLFLHLSTRLKLDTKATHGTVLQHRHMTVAGQAPYHLKLEARASKAQAFPPSKY